LNGFCGEVFANYTADIIFAKDLRITGHSKYGSFFKVVKIVTPQLLFEKRDPLKLSLLLSNRFGHEG
jgi:hypothetical protein